MTGYSEQDYQRGHRQHHTQFESNSPERESLFRRSIRLRRPSDYKIKRTSVDFVVGALVKSKEQDRQLPRLHPPSSINPPVPFLRKHSNSLKLCPKSPGDSMAAVDSRRGSTRPGPMVGGPISGMVHRPSLAENVRTASRDSTAGVPIATGIAGLGEEKPIASGNGVSLSIALAEPVLFLQGFDQSDLGNQTTTMLRGTFHLRVSKSAKIKTVSLAFRGRAETDWPEGQYRH